MDSKNTERCNLEAGDDPGSDDSSNNAESTSFYFAEDFAAEMGYYHELFTVGRRILIGLADMVATISEYRSLKNRCSVPIENSYTAQLEHENDKSSAISKIPESPIEFDFRPRQIAMLIETFLRLGNESLIDLSKFEFAIQDVADMSKTSQNEKAIYLPKAWVQLSPIQIKYACDLLKGQRDSVNWRNFVIDNMGIPFPTQSELLSAYHQFQTLDPNQSYLVNKNQFDLVTLWFESSDPSDASLQNVTPLIWRECIFHMFNESGFFPFVDFLFYFCKDEDPNFGFAKILAIFTDRIVPTSYLFDIGQMKSSELEITDSDIEFLLEETEVPEELIYTERAGEDGEEEQMETEDEEMFWRPVPLSKRLALIHKLRHEDIPSSAPLVELVLSQTISSRKSGTSNSTGTVQIESVTDLEESGERERTDEGGEEEDEEFQKLTGGLSHFHFLPGAGYPYEEDGEYYVPRKSQFRIGPNSPQHYEEAEGEWSTGVVPIISGKNQAQSRGSEEGDDKDKAQRKSNKKGKKLKNGQESLGDLSSGKPKKRRTKGGIPGESDRNSEIGSFKESDKKSKKGAKKLKKLKQTEDKPSSAEGISASVEALPLIEEEDEPEEEVLGENEFNGEMEGEEVLPENLEFPPSDLSLISAEAFTQAIWFGHKNTYPIKKNSGQQISRELIKLKELIVEVFNETNQIYNSPTSPQSVFNAKLGYVLKHPFIKEMMKRYKGFRQQNIPEIIKNASRIQEDLLEFHHLNKSAFSSSIESELGIYDAVKQAQETPAHSIVSDISYQNSFTQLITGISADEVVQESVNTNLEETALEAQKTQDSETEKAQPAVELIPVSATSSTSFSSLRDSLRIVYASKFPKIRNQNRKSIIDYYLSFGSSSDESDFEGQSSTANIIKDEVGNEEVVEEIVETKNDNESFSLAEISEETDLVRKSEENEEEGEDEGEPAVQTLFDRNLPRKLTQPEKNNCPENQDINPDMNERILQLHKILTQNPNRAKLAKLNFINSSGSRSTTSSKNYEKKLATTFGLDLKLESLLWK